MGWKKRSRKEENQTPQYKKNHDTTTKIYSTKLTIKTNQPLMRVEKKIEV